MKRKTVWISCILAALFCGRVANASVIITLLDVSSNVEATANGTLDLIDLLPLPTNAPILAVISPDAEFGELGVGEVRLGSNKFYDVSGPLTFGTGGFVLASTSTGNSLFLSPNSLLVPSDYVSGSSLSSTATWNNTTLATLGVTPGTYTWTWGTGAHADSVTLEAGIPEPGSALLLTLGVAGFALLRRRSSIEPETLSNREAGPLTKA